MACASCIRFRYLVYGCPFYGDTGGYVVSILAYEGVQEYVEENPVVGEYRSENPFWEFGHLLWRPLGLVLFTLLPVLVKPRCL